MNLVPTLIRASARTAGMLVVDQNVRVSTRSPALLARKVLIATRQTAAPATRAKTGQWLRKVRRPARCASLGHTRPQLATCVSSARPVDTIRTRIL